MTEGRTCHSEVAISDYKGADAFRSGPDVSVPEPEHSVVSFGLTTIGEPGDGTGVVAIDGTGLMNLTDDPTPQTQPSWR